MKVSKTQNALNGIFWGLIAKISTLFLPFLVRYVVIYYFSIEYTGLDSLFGSIFQILNFAELGIGSALLYAMYKPMAEGDVVVVNALLSFYKKSYMVIGVIILGTGICFFPFLRNFIYGNIPDGINIHILYILSLLNTSISYFLFAYKKTILNANQRVDILNKISFFVSIGQQVAKILIIFFTRNFYFYFGIGIVFTLVDNLWTAFAAGKMYPEYVAAGKINKKHIDSIKLNVIGLIAKNTGNLFMRYVDTIVISAFLGLAILGRYNNYFYIVTSVAGGIGVFSVTLRPIIGSNIAMNDTAQNKIEFFRINFIYSIMIGWSSLLMVLLYQPFIQLWVGKDNLLPDYMAVLFTGLFFVWMMTEVTRLYQESAGLWWEGKWVPIISSVLNLISNLILVNIVGLSGVVFSTILAYVVINIPFNAYIVFKYYFKEISMLKKYINYCFIVTVITVIICFLSSLFFEHLEVNNNIIVFLLRASYGFLIPLILMEIFLRNNPNYIWLKTVLKSYVSRRDKD